jgi:hypothetical protein
MKMTSILQLIQLILDCLPSSVFSGGGEQVDMGRKLQEDPLYIIKKKEIESRSQILRNPVKLKQLHELVRRVLMYVFHVCYIYPSVVDRCLLTVVIFITTQTLTDQP